MSCVFFHRSIAQSRLSQKSSGESICEDFKRRKIFNPKSALWRPCCSTPTRNSLGQIPSNRVRLRPDPVCQNFICLLEIVIDTVDRWNRQKTSKRKRNLAQHDQAFAKPRCSGIAGFVPAAVYFTLLRNLKCHKFHTRNVTQLE